MGKVSVLPLGPVVRPQAASTAHDGHGVPAKVYDAFGGP